MTTLTQQLEQLQKQQEKLEKRIQDEKEQKRLEHQSTIEHLEELVKPFTEEMDIKGKILDYTVPGTAIDNIHILLKEIKISKRDDKILIVFFQKKFKTI